VLPVGGQRLAVRTEHLADVGGVVLAGIEVDIVGDLDGKVQGDLRERDQGRLDPVAAGRVGQDLGQPASGRRSGSLVENTP